MKKVHQLKWLAVMHLSRRQFQKRQLVKHRQHRQVLQQVQHLDLDQADHVPVTIHLLQHRAHRALAIIHFHPAAQGHALVVA